MNFSHPDDPQVPASPQPVHVRCFGVGSAGVRLVEAMVRSGLPASAGVAVNTDLLGLEGCALESRLQIGAKLTRGLGAGGDPEVGRSALEEARAAVEAACAGTNLVFVVVGLGGGTGTGASPGIARMAREAGGLVIAVATMPFDCEGARRRQQALAGLEQLRAAADVLLCLPHQRVLKALDENTSLVEAFQHTEKLLGQGVNGIWQMLSQPGLIQADFADLRRALMGRQVQGAFASVEAAGEHRVREAIEKLTASPLLEGGTLLAEAETVLVNLRAGVDLAVGEIERVTDQIQRRCESAQLIVGAAVDASMGDRLSLTVVAAHRLAIPAPPSSGAPLRKAHPKEDWVGGDSLFARAGTESSRGAGGVDASRALRDLREVAPSGGGPDKAGSARARIRMEQALLPLESASKGRFEKSEPTLYQGEDLDVPTYVRRGVVLN